MTKIAHGGFVVTDKQNGIIWGLGLNEDAAWEDFIDEMKTARIEIVDKLFDDETGEPLYDHGGADLASNYHLQSASAALLEKVRKQGGDIGYGEIGGVLCTKEEAED